MSRILALNERCKYALHMRVGITKINLVTGVRVRKN